MSSADQRILIVDDHPIVRRGLRQLIDGAAGLRVCAEASSAVEAIRTVDEVQPDLVITDLSLGETSGLELTKQLQARFPDVPVLVLSLHDEEVYADRALQAGARGYVMKRASDEHLLGAIRGVLQGRRVVSEAIEARLFEQQAEACPSSEEGSAPTDGLSDREMEVFRLIGQGYAPRHIAERLDVSVKTVETHRQRIRQKLGLESAAVLARYAVQWHKDRGGA